MPSTARRPFSRTRLWACYVLRRAVLTPSATAPINDISRSATWPPLLEFFNSFKEGICPDEPED